MKKNFKRYFTIGATVCLLSAISVPAFAAQGSGGQGLGRGGFAGEGARLEMSGEELEAGSKINRGVMFKNGGMSQTSDASERPEPPQDDAGFRKGSRGMMDLSELVDDGVISQETADEIAVYMEEQMAARKAEMDSLKDMTESERQAQFESGKEQRADIFEEMVSAGIITQDEADAIMAAMPRPQNRPESEAESQL